MYEMEATVNLGCVEDNLDYIYTVLREIKEELSVSNELTKKRMQIEGFRLYVTEMTFKRIFPDILRIDYGIEWFLDDKRYKMLLKSLVDKDDIASCMRIRQTVTDLGGNHE